MNHDDDGDDDDGGGGGSGSGSGGAPSADPGRAVRRAALCSVYLRAVPDQRQPEVVVKPVAIAQDGSNTSPCEQPANLVRERADRLHPRDRNVPATVASKLDERKPVGLCTFAASRLQDPDYSTPGLNSIAGMLEQLQPLPVEKHTG